MIFLCLALIALSLAISLPATFLMRELGHRMNALDSAGVAGQVKEARRKIPNLGGVAIFFGIAIPMFAGLVLAKAGVPDALLEAVPMLKQHLPGLLEKSRDAMALLTGLAALHVLGVLDDRRPMGPFIKLAIMAAISLAVIWFTDSRLLTMLDGYVGGSWASMSVTLIWFLIIINAMNFMDNMDGLSGGVGAIAAALFLVATIVHGQWFVAACLALLVGSLMGFLHFNFPKGKGASIFMGDGGSLVVGFLLAFLTTRTTYVADSAVHPSAWYGVFMPVIVLAIPLYDFCTVVTIRLSQGKSPFVGDLQHFSHRLVKLGLSKRAAVLVIYGFTAITGVAGVSLASLAPWQAILVAIQVLLLLGVLAAFERAHAVNSGARA